MAERILKGQAFSAPRQKSKANVTPASILGPRLLFILTTIALLVFGLVMVYSASFVEAFTNTKIEDSSYFFRHQLLLAGIGLVAMSITIAIDYRVWNTLLSWLPWALVVLLLVLTLAIGNEELGGQRWFDLFGFSLQPSEFAKPALVLLFAMLAVKLRTEGFSTQLIILIAAAIAIPLLLIALQPDLGTMLIVLAGFISIAWLAEFPFRYIGLTLAIIILMGVAAIAFTDFRMDRIDAWLDPEGNAADSGYQIMNSFYAFADGGISGVGLGMSHQKYLYLPQPHNDLIFPIIGEEFGLIGAVAVVVLFMIFLYAAYRISHDSVDMYGRIVAGSAASIIGFQAFLNMLCMVNLLPMTGKPLPFFSAGGSSIVVTLMMVGLILNVSLRSKEADPAEAKREELLIIEGGRRASKEDKRSSKRQPQQPQQLQQPLRRQPARATATNAQQLRKPPARAAATSTQQLRRPPARPARPATLTNPALRMSPARNQQAARPLSSTRSAKR
jgi:cell division protein FtsW